MLNEKKEQGQGFRRQRKNVVTFAEPPLRPLEDVGAEFVRHRRWSQGKPKEVYRRAKGHTRAGRLCCTLTQQDTRGASQVSPTARLRVVTRQAKSGVNGHFAPLTPDFNDYLTVAFCSITA